jgi:hypothetical protein
MKAGARLLSRHKFQSIQAMSPSIDSRENREFASEMKFLVSSELAAQIRGWARGHLSPDPYAGGEAGDGYQITSLYFDTEPFDVFHRRGSYGRSKFRIRRYGEGEVAFLERKLKTRGLLTKRRSIVKLEELERLSALEATKDWAGYWFHRRLLARGLSPVCQISYRRTARVAMTPNGPIRLTLDDNLRALPAAGMWFSDNEFVPLMEHLAGDPGMGRSADSLVREFPAAGMCGHGCPRSEMPLMNDQIILELKFRYGMPALFKYLVEEFALTPQPFSKYRLAAARLDLAPAAVSETEEAFRPQHA